MFYFFKSRSSLDEFQCVERVCTETWLGSFRQTEVSDIRVVGVRYKDD